MNDSIIEIKNINLQHLKLKNKQKINSYYEIIPIQYLNKDLIFQTPKMNIPFGINSFNDQYYLKLSFLNSENDVSLLDFQKIMLRINSSLKKSCGVNKNNYHFINPLKKYKDFPYTLSSKIFNNPRDNLLIFDQYKNIVDLKDIRQNDYCKSILYISNIWINHNNLIYGYDIYVLQLKIYSIYRHLSEYSFIEDSEDVRLQKHVNGNQEEERSSVSSYQNSESNMIEVQYHLKYKKYFKMLSFGVPKENIRSQMRIDGLNESIIDYQPQHLISKLPETGSSQKLPLGKLNIQQLLDNKLKLKKTDIKTKSQPENKTRKSLFRLEDILKRIKNLKKTNITLI